VAETVEETPTRRSRRLLPLDLLRGFLIGLAELVPGVSGGTVALVTRVYDQLIESASHLLSAVRRLVTGPDRRASTRVELRRTDWWLVVPVLVGMAAAVLTMAGLMSSFVTDHPEHARGLFLGLVAVSVAVPLRMLPPAAHPWWRDAVPLLVAAVAAFVLVGLAGGRVVDDPPLVVVLLAASVAICALVVPGVSGSFLLLAVGLYEPTLDAVHDRDLGYIAVFAAGAVVGLASFVRLLTYLLSSHRRTTLLAMAGLMIGSLRALWPWQSSPGGGEGPGSLIAPADPVWGPVALAVTGGLAVLALLVVETRHSARATP
jgi:putative membrane protein